MRRLVMTLAATSLVMCGAQYGWTEPSPNSAKTDKIQGAKMAELKGDLARIHKDNAAAVSDYMAALRVNRQDAELYNKLGIAELQLKEYGLARKDFAQALKLDPKLTSAVNNLGVIALLDKRFKQAIVYFKSALAMDETVASTHLNLAEAWMGQGEIDYAMTEYGRALELDADILTSSEEGIIAQVATPQQRARVAYLIARAYARRGNLDGALDSLRKARDLHYYGLGNVYADQDFAALWKDPRLAQIVKR